MLVATLGCIAALVAMPDAIGGHPTPARHGLSSLPEAAQGPISAALGRDESAYRVLGLHALSPAQRLRIGFSPAGVTVNSGGARLGMTLSAFGYASAVRPLGAVAPRARANRVSYGHGSLREWFANGPLGLEQGFDVAARPSAGGGPLTFSLSLSGNLTSRREGGSLLLEGRGVSLRYGGLLAADARGRVLHSWLQLAGSHVLIRVDDRGAVYPLRIDPIIQQQAELFASDGAKGDELGESVAVSGNTIVVGAPAHAVGGNANQGAAYVFVMPASGWAGSLTQTAELTAKEGEANEEFGKSVAISGTTVAVGARKRKVKNKEQGEAYVFVRPATGWAGSLTETAGLTAKEGETEEELGQSIAISGTTVAVGVGENAKPGAVYVFVMPASGWVNATQTAELTAKGGKAKEFFGYSVAVSGNTIVAGAGEHEVGKNPGQGAAYVFVMPSSGWVNATQTAELTAEKGEANEFFGGSVAISGNTIVVGAQDRKVANRANQGAAYVFVMPASGWANANQAAELTASGGSAFLGFSVAVSGDTVVAGALFQEVGGNEKQGAAYVFARPASGWAGSLNQTAELAAERGEANELFGKSVAVSGNTVAAGAPERKVGNENQQGTAYAFLAPSPSVAISSPVNGAVYTQGQAVAAGYACRAFAWAGVETCAGPAADGALIDTSAPGPHAFTVETTDSDGLSASQSVSYTVVAIASPLAPILSGLSETAKIWREGNLLAHFSVSKKGKKKLPVGTTLSFSLNEPAIVTFTFTEPASGRKVGKKCVAQTKRNGKRKRCTRTVIAGALTFSAHVGTNKVRFEGLISKHKKLKPGSYTLLVTATASGKHSTTRMLHFTIAKG